MTPSRTIQLSDRPRLTVAPRRPPSAFRPSAPTPQVDEPARPSPTWESLVQSAPGLATFADEARVAGERGLWWWPAWAAAYYDFRKALYQAADTTGTAFADALAVAMDHLTTTYHRAGRKLQRGIIVGNGRQI